MAKPPHPIASSEIMEIHVVNVSGKGARRLGVEYSPLIQSRQEYSNHG